MRILGFPIGFAIPPFVGLIASAIGEMGASPMVLWVLVPATVIICVTIWGVDAFGLTACYHHMSGGTLLAGGMVAGFVFLGSLWVLAQYGMQQLIYGGLVSCLVIPALSLLLLKRIQRNK